MSTTTLRSTIAITTFVQASRKAFSLRMQLNDVERQMAELKDDVLSQIGESRTVKVDGAISTLTPRVKESISRTCDDQTAVEYFRSHGLKVSTRSPEYVAPASFTSAVKAGQVSADLFEKTQTIDVNVI